MRMIFNNVGDVAAIAASPAMVTTLPVSNLQTESREDVARTTSTATQSVTLTWSTAQLFTGCVLYRGNFTTAATWRVQIYDTSAMGSLLYDSGVQNLNPAKTLGDLDWGSDPLGVSLFTGWGFTYSRLYFTQVTAAYAVITLTDVANPDGYMQASRLFMGTYIEPTYMPVQGAFLQWQETTKLARTDGGTLRSEPGANYRKLTVQGKFLPEKDRIALSNLMRTNGMRNDIFIDPFPTQYNALARDWAMQGKLVALDPMAIPTYGAHDVQLQFEEV